MRMPAIFVGHGSPMNAIVNNRFTDEWHKIGEKYKPSAILMISGHWFTQGNLVQSDLKPKKINDMYGFPKELYAVDYTPLGDKALTQEILKCLGDKASVDNNWGIDHGAWAVLVHMYPEGNIPVVQLSVNRSGTVEDQFKIGQLIRKLRDQGVMIIGSGNIVHNLGYISANTTEGNPFAVAFDNYIEEAIKTKTYSNCINYLEFGKNAKLAVPTPEHFYPLLNVLGTVYEEDQVTVYNKGYDLASISMTSYLFN